MLAPGDLNEDVELDLPGPGAAAILEERKNGLFSIVSSMATSRVTFVGKFVLLETHVLGHVRF